MNQKKSIKNIIMHGGILAMAGIFVRIIGLVYRIPMVNIIGAEANGIYGAAFNVYNIMNVINKRQKDFDNDIEYHLPKYLVNQ